MCLTMIRGQFNKSLQNVLDGFKNLERSIFLKNPISYLTTVKFLEKSDVKFNFYNRSKQTSLVNVIKLRITNFVR